MPMPTNLLFTRSQPITEQTVSGEVEIVKVVVEVEVVVAEVVQTIKTITTDARIKSVPPVVLTNTRQVTKCVLHGARHAISAV